MPTYSLGCWTWRGLEGHVRAAPYVIELQQALLGGAVAAPRARGEEQHPSPALCVSLPGRGWSWGHVQPLGYSRSDSEIIQGVLGQFMPVKHRHTGSFHYLLKKNITLASYPQWVERTRCCAHLLCSNGAALLSTVSLGVAPGVFRWGGKHAGLCACWGALSRLSKGPSHAANSKSSADEPH